MQLFLLPSSGTVLVSALLAVLPVCLFLAFLLALDSFKLVRRRALLQALTAGATAAAAALVVNSLVAETAAMDARATARFVAPAVEETLKAGWVLFLLRSRRVGFVVDAGILGFAVGTGFACAENLYYVVEGGQAGVVVWAMRGVGTALIHGGATCIVGMIGQGLSERPSVYVGWMLGLAIAVGVHSLFNAFVLQPVVFAVVALSVMPPLVAVVFLRTERLVREWLGHGFDADQELLTQLTYLDPEQSRIGRFLQALTKRFPGACVADMLGLMRLRVELSVAIKGRMLMRDAGFWPTVPDHLEETLTEIDELERRIGPIGMLVIRPVLRPSPPPWALAQLKDVRTEPSGARGVGRST